MLQREPPNWLITMRITFLIILRVIVRSNQQNINIYAIILYSDVNTPQE